MSNILKNYTSTTPAMQTLSFIEAYLSSCPGVSGIAKEIKGGQVHALFFRIEVTGRTHTVRLPAKVDEVQEVLWKDYCCATRRPRKTKEDFREQAIRTAWKIQQDWVQVQMSLIKLKQVEFLQVFLAFIWDGNQTYYDFIKGGNFKALPHTTG